MGMYRKKPVVVEAIQFEYSPEGIKKLEEFCGPSLGGISKARHPYAKAEAQIFTLEDGEYVTVKHIATEGDWIIKGVVGEFYPCKPEVFEQTYEKAELGLSVDKPLGPQNAYFSPSDLVKTCWK